MALDPLTSLPYVLRKENLNPGGPHIKQRHANRKGTYLEKGFSWERDGDERKEGGKVIKNPSYKWMKVKQKNSSEKGKTISQ